MFRLSHQMASVAATLALLGAPAALAQEAQDSDEADAAPASEAQTGREGAEGVDACRRWSDEDAAFVMSQAGDSGCEVVVVTGTRLLYDPTSRVLVITAEEIEARGLATTEEIMRAIPQNVSTVNAYNNSVRLSTGLDPGIGGEMAIGVSTANLRGLGSRNTLVLVNGRRVAGAAGSDDFFANVNNIPAAAIDRVEVSLDGAGAVYGSDAVGGVVNIILKSDYAVNSLTGRYEQSATGGDQNRLDANLGYSWGAGNVTAVLSRTERDPVSNHKTGFTTRDYRPRFGPSEDYNFVGDVRPRSGLVAASRWAPYLILPPGNDGRNAAPGDFVPTKPSDFRDVVVDDAGGSAEALSGTLAVTHTFFDKLALHGEVLWQETTTKARNAQAVLATTRVPASNAFNNFGQDVYARYDAQREIDDGLIQPGENTAVREHGRYMVGLDYTWNDTKRVVLDHTYAVSDGYRRQYRFQPGSVITSDAQNERLTELLNSSDPNVAPNFFGDGSGQNDTFAEFYLPTSQDTDRAYTSMTTAYFRGDVFNAPGGRVQLAVGGEVRSEWFQDLDFSNEAASGIGVAKPTRDITATFLEMQVPLFGQKNARRGLQVLAVTAKARYDKYQTDGAAGKEKVSVTFDNVAPYFGIVYKPMADLTLRISQSEGFVVPRFRSMFSTTYIEQSFFVFDPLKGTYVPGRFVSGSNPDLKPEVSTTLSAGFDWTPSRVEDFGVEMYYSEVDIRDRVAGNFELGQLLPAAVYGNLPQFFVRAEDGTLLTAINTFVNIARRVSKTVDLTVYKTFPSAFGEFLVEARYNGVLNQFDQPFEDGDRISMVGKSIGVDRYKAAVKLRWRRGRTTVNAFLNYTPGYVNNDHQRQTDRDIPLMDVSSWTTLDVSVSHRFENGMRVQAGARDLLGRKFPFMLSRFGRPWDSKRVDLRGRVMYLTATYQFGLDK